MDLARWRARELRRRAKSEPRRDLVACQSLATEGGMVVFDLVLYKG